MMGGGGGVLQYYSLRSEPLPQGDDRGQAYVWDQRNYAVPYYLMDGEGQPELRARLHRIFDAYFCCIYDLVTPGCLAYDEMA